MSPTVLLFDFGGTLDADGIPWARRFHTAYADAGGALDFAAFEPVYQASDVTLAALLLHPQDVLLALGLPTSNLRLK